MLSPHREAPIPLEIRHRGPLPEGDEEPTAPARLERQSLDTLGVPAVPLCGPRIQRIIYRRDIVDGSDTAAG